MTNCKGRAIFCLSQGLYHILTSEYQSVHASHPYSSSWRPTNAKEYTHTDDDDWSTWA